MRSSRSVASAITKAKTEYDMGNIAKSKSTCHMYSKHNWYPDENNNNIYFCFGHAPQRSPDTTSSIETEAQSHPKVDSHHMPGDMR